jgi:phosphoribosyl 1,2-cyclic phosphate phosphodiesterase
MPDKLQLTILGCGSSPGVPRIGNDWGACDPGNAKNVRQRCSAHIRRITPTGQTTEVLIDTSPDLRGQALAARIHRLDGVLFTHAHADHIHGIDDLRAFVLNMRRRVEVYADQPTLMRLREGFGYCFATPPGSDYPPIINANLIEPPSPVVVTGPGGPVSAVPIIQTHGRSRSLGFRFGDLAYSPDVSALDANAEAMLQDLDVWILDALRYKPHPSHFSVDEAVATIQRLKPKRAILTHMHVDLDYEALRSKLPDGIEPAYDGMVIEVPVSP